MVEVDLGAPLPETVMLERQGHCALVSIFYERLPDFCTHCSVVGHSATNFRWNKTKDGEKDDGVTNNSRRSRSRSQSFRKKNAMTSSDKGKEVVSEAPPVNASSIAPASTSEPRSHNSFQVLNSLDISDKQLVGDPIDKQMQVLSTEGLPLERTQELEKSQSASITSQQSIDGKISESGAISDESQLDTYTLPASGKMDSGNSEFPSELPRPPTPPAHHNDETSRLDAIKQKLEEIRASSEHPASTVLVSSSDDNNALRMMTVAANKSWADLAELPDGVPKGILRKPTRNLSSRAPTNPP